MLFICLCENIQLDTYYFCNAWVKFSKVICLIIDLYESKIRLKRYNSIIFLINENHLGIVANKEHTKHICMCQQTSGICLTIFTNKTVYHTSMLDWGHQTKFKYCHYKGNKIATIPSVENKCYNYSRSLVRFMVVNSLQASFPFYCLTS